MSDIKLMNRGAAAHGGSTKIVCVRMKPDMLARLDDLAKASGVNRSSVIVHAVNQFMKTKK